MEPITGRFIQTLDDCLVGSKYLVSGRSLNRWINVILMLFLVHLLWTLRGNLDLPGMIYSVLPFLILVAFLKFFLPFIQRRQFTRHPETNMEMVYSITDVAIRFESEVSTIETRWRAFKKIVSAPEGFVFMPTSQSFHFLPIRAFSSPADIENLKTLARQHAADFKEVR